MFTRFETASRPPDISNDPIQTSESLICAVAAVTEARKARRKTIWRMGGSYRGMRFGIIRRRPRLLQELCNQIDTGSFDPGDIVSPEAAGDGQRLHVEILKNPGQR